MERRLGMLWSGAKDAGPEARIEYAAAAVAGVLDRLGYDLGRAGDPGRARAVLALEEDVRRRLEALRDGGPDRPRVRRANETGAGAAAGPRSGSEGGPVSRP